MRITNRIMTNNAMYNINNNKINEDRIFTQITTGKKIDRPSADPVIAIRALSLRATMAELAQYYEKNSKDAQSWLEVTEASLSTGSHILTDIRRLAVSGPDTYKTLQDWTTVVNQMDTLADEYYSTGNVDYAGRYIYTGFRTNSTLTYPQDTTEEYSNIHDEFNADHIDTSTRVTNMQKLADGDEITAAAQKESDMKRYEVGRLRLSYDNIKTSVPPSVNDISVKYREPMLVSAVSELQPDTRNIKTVNLSFTDAGGQSHTVHVPVSNGAAAGGASPAVVVEGETYSAAKNPGIPTTYTLNTASYGTFTINEKGVITAPPAFPTGNVLRATTEITESRVATVTFTADTSSPLETVNVPLTTECRQPYTVACENGYTAQVNTDGTVTLSKSVGGANPMTKTVRMTANGSVSTSYNEVEKHPDAVITGATSQDDIDTLYSDLAAGTKDMVFNAVTGELLFSKSMQTKLSGLKDMQNAKTIDVVYDKSNFKKGETRPEHLFTCTKGGIIYNSGSGGHTMHYDVGYNQTIDVNTTADDIFTNELKRGCQDLKRVLAQMSDVDAKLNTLKEHLRTETLAANKANIEAEIKAAKKAYDYLTDTMKRQFSTKITEVKDALDRESDAITVNGTRSMRLDLIQTRLQSQSTTFKELQENNEGINMEEAATNLATAKNTYSASLMATGKILQHSLMDYI